MLDNLPATALIITANQRQALDVRRRYRLPDERVMALSTFIEYYWRCLMAKALKPARWLTTFEQHVLWQRLILQDEDEASTDDPALVSACCEAWGWLHAWQVPLTALNTYATVNSLWFYPIAERYRATCRDNNWQDSELALAYLILEAQALSRHLPKEIVFYRFWQTSPAVQNLQTALAQHGVKSMAYQPALPLEQEKWRYEADSSSAELASMVDWLGVQVSLYPKQRFACVMPDLQRDRALLDYYVRHNPPLTSSATVHFSLGQALLDYPLVQVAWRLLSFSQSRDLSVEDLSYLSHSPFWHHSAAIESLLSRWRVNQLASFPLSAWQQYASVELQQWRQDLLALITLKALPSVWAVRFKDTLALCGWPKIVLSLDEQAIAQRFNDALDAFSALDDFLGVLKQREALDHCHTLLTQTIFEPPAKQTPQIYFLGLVEVLGSDFDVVWLTDVTLYRWPALPRANALLPLKCQAAYQLPQATAASRFTETQQLWQELARSGGQLIVSHARWRGGEPQCGQVDAWPLLVWQPSVTSHKASFAKLPTDTQGLPCDMEQAPGGTAALKAQAHCPFQAFGHYRLNLRALPVASSALTAAERGMLVHRVLYELWQELGSQQVLLATAKDVLTSMIKRACQTALADLNPWRRRYLAKTLLSLEQQRLEQLTQDWFSLEATRPPFRISQVEAKTTATFAGKTWRLRPDRIDQLASGELLLIDYKTGLASINWQAEPLLEPQLPFYAVLNSQEISGLMIAYVTAGVKKITGLAEVSVDCGALGQLKASDEWTQQCQTWLEALNQLATNYFAGVATVQPVKGDTTCRNCDLQAVCRIAELSSLTGPGDDCQPQQSGDSDIGVESSAGVS